MNPLTPTGRPLRKAAQKSPKPPKKRAATNAERVQSWRDRMKQDPEAYQAYLQKEKERACAYRTARKLKVMTDAEIEHSRSLARARQQRYMQKLKQKPQTGAARHTRLDKKKLEEKKEYNRLAQQKCRANWSHQKRSKVNRTRREKYHQTKTSADHICPTVPKPTVSTDNNVNATFPNQESYKRAVRRLRSKVKDSGLRFALLVKGLIRSAKKDSLAHLKELNVTCVSPQKQQLPTAQAVHSHISSTSKARSKSVVACRKELINIFNAAADGNKVRSRATSRRKVTTSKYGELVRDFYAEESIPLPDKKCNTQRGAPKRILQEGIKFLHKRFLSRYGPKVSLRTFFRQKPKNILSVSKNKFRQAMCEVCLNPKYKITVLNQLLAANHSTSSLLSESLCAIVGTFHQVRCVERKCQCCGVTDVKKRLLSDLGEKRVNEVVWRKWALVKKDGKSGKMEKTVCRGSSEEMLNELLDELNFLSKHQFVSQWQRHQFNLLRKSLKPGMVITIHDFAENFLCQQQDEPQAAHWNYTQVTVHPVVNIYLCPHCSKEVITNLVFVSPDLCHDAHMAQSVMVKTFDYLQQKISCISKVFIWSDCCAAQYRSRLPFYLFSKIGSLYPFEMERCFFGPRHGKSMCDSLGGRVKMSASRAVAAGKWEISDAKSFYDFCKSDLTRNEHQPCQHSLQDFILISDGDVSRNFSSEALKTIKGTRNIQSVRPIAEGKMEIRKLSCFCFACISGSPSSFCNSADFVDSWARVTFYTSSVRPQTIDKQSFFNKLYDDMLSCTSFINLLHVCHAAVEGLRQFSLPLLFPTILSTNSTIDYVALNMRPMGLEHLYPVLTGADGNCLPRSLSKFAYGREEYHKEMRCRLICELVCHRNFYLNYFSKEECQQIMTLTTDEAVQYKNPQDVFEMEVLETVRLGTDMGLWHMAAAASIFQTKLFSVYPTKGPECHRKLLNRTLKPRVSVSESEENALGVMWSSCRDDLNEEYWVANHFVPLLPLYEPTLVEVM